MVEEQSDVKQLDLLPGGVVNVLGIEFIAQALDAFIDAVVIKTDALLHCLVYAKPVGLFKTRLGFAAGLAEQRVMLVESLNHGQRNLVRVGAVKAD